MTWLPTFLIETQGRSLAGAALFTALIVSFTGLGVVAGASLLHRGASRWLLIGSAYLAMGVCAAALFAPVTPDVAKIPLALCFTLLGGLLPAACFEGGAAHAPSREQIAMASGFVAQGAALGSVIGPAVAGRRNRGGRRLGICVVDHAGLSRSRLGGRRRRAKGGRAARATDDRARETKSLARISRHAPRRVAPRTMVR